MDQPVRIRRALISVSDKDQLVPLAQALCAVGAQIISTGGTAAALAKAGIAVTPIEEVTGFPEMLDGRVKTLHPRVHGGLLAVRSNLEHRAAMAEHGIEPIDLVCVNLYPFERTVLRHGVAEHEAIEQIDIGGPSMLRSAAKNFESVTVVTDPSQYAQVIQELQQHGGGTTLALRRRLAAQVFARTAAYDGAIAAWMHKHPGDAQTSGTLPPQLELSLPMQQLLRYGENPHQLGALYRDPTFVGQSVAAAELLRGKPLSYNNLLDAAAALELVQDLHAQGSLSACAVIKHTNACGAALAPSALQAFHLAWGGDPLAAFGGVVAFSAEVDTATATEMVKGERFLEVVVAPSFAPHALTLLESRWKNARLLAVGHTPRSAAQTAAPLSLRSIPGGVLAQQQDMHAIRAESFVHAAGPAPTAAMLRDAGAMFVVAKHLKSNAVCIGCNLALLGAGAGQMDRVASCRGAIAKARAHLDALPASDAPVAASDAFFPFADGPTLLADAGVKCIVHPGGSKRDQETFDLCNQRAVTCMITGTRHFRH